MIRKAELAKARMFQPKGEDIICSNITPQLINPAQPLNLQSVDIPFEFVAKIDQDYLMIGGHVDEAMRTKIVRGDYIDFSKLIPKDRILTEEDDRLELVVRNGRTF